MHCGADFIAKTTTTQYCSHNCSRKAYKAKLRDEKIKVSNEETQAVKLAPIDTVKAKEFLTVKDVAILLNCSTRTAYRLIATCVIPSINLAERKTTIRRTDLDKLFEKPQAPPPEIRKSKIKEWTIDDCYNLSDIEKSFGISKSAINEIIKRNDIPKLRLGWYTYVPKELIRNILGTPKKK
jgi:excisionase family DNA binding protein